MRDYGTVSPQFWIGETGKSLRGDMEAQLVALYLMTSPHANMIGVFHCPADYIAKETGLTLEGALKGLTRLIEGEFCRQDGGTEEVFVLRMAAYQIGEQLLPKDKRCIGVARELEKVMSAKLRQGFHAIYSGAFHLPKLGKKISPSEAPPKPRAGTGAGTGTGQVLAPTELDGCAAELPYHVPNCPHEEIQKAYAELLPALPQIAVMSDVRKGHMTARWREICADGKLTREQGVEWFRDFFKVVAKSAFLTGNGKPNREGRVWAADFDWLMLPTNFVKVVEGRYQDRRAA